MLKWSLSQNKECYHQHKRKQAIDKYIYYETVENEGQKCWMLYKAKELNIQIAK